MLTRSEIEEAVRRELEDQFHTTLSKMRLSVGTKTNGDNRFHEFDCVSADSQIVAEIKSNELKASPDKPQGRYFSAIKWALLGDIYMLSRIQANTKLLVLTDEPLFQICKDDMDGILPDSIQLMLKTIDSGKSDDR